MITRPTPKSRFSTNQLNKSSLQNKEQNFAQTILKSVQRIEKGLFGVDRQASFLTYLEQNQTDNVTFDVMKSLLQCLGSIVTSHMPENTDTSCDKTSLQLASRALSQLLKYLSSLEPMLDLVEQTGVGSFNLATFIY